jgi:hypothetical protein
VDFVEDF